MKAKLVTQPVDRLDCAPLPAIPVDRYDGFFIFARYDNGPGNGTEPPDAAKARVLIQRPGEPPAVLGMEDFRALWSGPMIFLTSKASCAGDLAKFDFT